MRELREADLRVDTYTSGVRSPVHVRVTHTPTGVTAEATDRSRIRAKRVALAVLRKRLERHEYATEVREAVDNLKHEVAKAPPMPMLLGWVERLVRWLNDRLTKDDEPAAPREEKP